MRMFHSFEPASDAIGITTEQILKEGYSVQKQRFAASIRLKVGMGIKQVDAALLQRIPFPLWQDKPMKWKLIEAEIPLNKVYVDHDDEADIPRSWGVTELQAEEASTWADLEKRERRYYNTSMYCACVLHIKPEQIVKIHECQSIRDNVSTIDGVNWDWWMFNRFPYLRIQMYWNIYMYPFRYGKYSIRAIRERIAKKE